MRIRLIYNPAAGTRRREAFQRKLAAFVARHGERFELRTTSGPGHAVELAREAAATGCAAAVAVGGDGTMNEVARGLVGTPCALGLVPRGSGNGLARHLGIPLDSTRALDLLLAPVLSLRPIDTGDANGHLFLNVMGVGFDAEVASRFAQSRRRGFLTYLRIVLQALGGIRPTRYQIAANRGETSIDALLIAVANSPQYGNGAAIAPGAAIDDGRLDLVAVGDLSRVAAIGLASRLFRGNFDTHPRVRRFLAPRYSIRRAQEGLIHLDGEPRTTGATVEVCVHPRSLRVIVPPAGLPPR